MNAIANACIGNYYTASAAATHGRVLILDLDSTLTDTRPWFADLVLPWLSQLASDLSANQEIVNQVFTEIAQRTTLHEYAYVAELIAFKLKAHQKLSKSQTEQAINAFWQTFSDRHKEIRIYESAVHTLKRIKALHADLKIIVLTDSPDWVAYERLELTGILELIDGLVAIRTERPKMRKRFYSDLLDVSEKRVSSQRSKAKHLLFQKSLPATYCKPSSAGIELILSWLGMPNPESVIICGDRETKEGLAAQNWRSSRTQLGLQSGAIHFVRALYGQADYAHPKYEELAKHIPSLAITHAPKDRDYAVSADLARFSELVPALEQIGRRPQSEALSRKTTAIF